MEKIQVSLTFDVCSEFSHLNLLWTVHALPLSLSFLVVQPRKFTRITFFCTISESLPRNNKNDSKMTPLTRWLVLLLLTAYKFTRTDYNAFGSGPFFCSVFFFFFRWFVLALLFALCFHFRFEIVSKNRKTSLYFSSILWIFDAMVVFQLFYIFFSCGTKCNTREKIDTTSKKLQLKWQTEWLFVVSWVFSSSSFSLSSLFIPSLVCFSCSTTTTATTTTPTLFYCV